MDIDPGKPRMWSCGFHEQTVWRRPIKRKGCTSGETGRPKSWQDKRAHGENAAPSAQGSLQGTAPCRSLSFESVTNGTTIVRETFFNACRAPDRFSSPDRVSAWHNWAQPSDNQPADPNVRDTRRVSCHTVFSSAASASSVFCHPLGR